MASDDVEAATKRENGATGKVKAFTIIYFTICIRAGADGVSVGVTAQPDGEHGVLRGKGELVEAFGDVAIVPTLKEMDRQKVVASEVVPGVSFRTVMVFCAVTLYCDSWFVAYFRFYNDINPKTAY